MSYEICLKIKIFTSSRNSLGKVCIKLIGLLKDEIILKIPNHFSSSVEQVFLGILPIFFSFPYNPSPFTFPDLQLYTALEVTPRPQHSFLKHDFVNCSSEAWCELSGPHRQLCKAFDLYLHFYFTYWQ